MSILSDVQNRLITGPAAETQRLSIIYRSLPMRHIAAQRKRASRCEAARQITTSRAGSWRQLFSSLRHAWTGSSRSSLLDSLDAAWPLLLADFRVGDRLVARLS